MFLQGNLLLEFKEGGTLLGRFWRGIWNWEDCFWLEDLKKKEEKKKGNRRILLLGESFFFYWGRRSFLEQHALEDFWGRRTEETEKSNCNQGYPGMLLVTLRILIHTRFFCVFDSWIFNCPVDFCVDEKGHNLLCWDWLLACLPCFDFGCH